MLLNLFSSFNPTQTPLNLSWLTILTPLMIIPLNKFIKMPNRQFSMTTQMKKMILKEITPLMTNHKTQGHLIFYLHLFLYISSMNLMSLFPHIFSPTTHMSVNLSMSFPLWLMLMFYGWIMTTKMMFSHLVPESTPIMLTPAMVLIETISNLIRPITLSIRLTANLIAGHLLIILLSSMYTNLSLTTIPMMIIPQLILLTLEIAVAMIQAYIFIILLSLYLTEI